MTGRYSKFEALDWSRFKEQLGVRGLLIPFETICLARGVTTREVYETRKGGPHVVAARRECMKHMLSIGWSILATSEFWGRDHSTLQHLVSKERRAAR